MVFDRITSRIDELRLQNLSPAEILVELEEFLSDLSESFEFEPISYRGRDFPANHYGLATALGTADHYRRVALGYGFHLPNCEIFRLSECDCAWRELQETMRYGVDD